MEVAFMPSRSLVEDMWNIISLKLKSIENLACTIWSPVHTQPEHKGTQDVNEHLAMRHNEKQLRRHKVSLHYLKQLFKVGL